MSRMAPRRAARSDDSRGPIVAALRAIGASVEDLGYPVDLLVGFKGRDFLIDCKSVHIREGKDGYQRRTVGKATEAQERFIREHRGSPVYFVTTPKEAVELVTARPPNVPYTPEDR